MNYRNHYVMKFGGSCLAGAEDMLNAASIVSEYRNCVVVVSAIKDVTQKLIGIADADEKSQILKIVDDLTRIHRSTISGIREEKRRNEAYREVEYLLELLTVTALESHGVENSQDRAKILSMGERLSATILKWYIRDLGLKSVAVNSDEIIFANDDEYLNANVDEEVSMSEIRSRLQLHTELSEIPVVTGFFCSSLSGRTALLGRNSSDYTAALVAFSLPTYELVFWKDVPGLMTEDPKLVKESHVLRLLTYEQAEGYIVNGAKVLHPKVTGLARRKGTTIRIRDFRNPESEGTLITGAIPSIEIL